ncbi:uncharacterized protein LOC142174855 isoform X2 [Nicotiana tabacum]|uniref:Uncharacterized protein LOC142174855 isoform X2 n=1 Tax=Nicotiana tabacum TaxID=4097 RepID=A0AC58TJC9_TOBAC
MGDDVFKEMKEYWESPEFKSKSEHNKKNRNSNDGASIHTERSHRKRTFNCEFYFQTHHTKNEKCWVNEKAEAAYNNFERTKQELSASQSASTEVHASNANLYAQLQEERRKNKKMRKELDLLKKYVNFNASSSNELSSQEDNQGSEDESDNDFDNVNESGSNLGNVNESDYN